MNSLIPPMGSRSPSPARKNENETIHLTQITTHPLDNLNVNGVHDEKHPLMEHEDVTPKPPLADSETDDLESVPHDAVPELFPGIDDGFFIENRAGEIPGNNIPSAKPPDVPNETPLDTVDGAKVPQFVPDHSGRFPYAPGFGGFDPETGTQIPDLESIPDVNVYQHKKTLAQGMMDLALFSANANQLRYVLESSSRHPYYYPSLVLIAISLMFQVSIINF